MTGPADYPNGKKKTERALSPVFMSFMYDICSVTPAMAVGPLTILETSTLFGIL